MRANLAQQINQRFLYAGRGVECGDIGGNGNLGFDQRYGFVTQADYIRALRR